MNTTETWRKIFAQNLGRLPGQHCSITLFYKSTLCPLYLFVFCQFLLNHQLSLLWRIKKNIFSVMPLCFARTDHDDIAHSVAVAASPLAPTCSHYCPHHHNRSTTMSTVRLLHLAVHRLPSVSVLHSVLPPTTFAFISLIVESVSNQDRFCRGQGSDPHCPPYK